jgi:Tol biopolymer transport system component
VQVTHKGGMVGAESTDGQYLYFTKGERDASLWRMSIDGGGEAQVLPSVYRYNFAVTRRGIYFTPNREKDGSSSVEFLNFASGRVTQVAKIEKSLDLGITVSPDGQTVLYTQIDYEGSDLMLVENFR